MGLSPQHGSHEAALTASNLWPDGSIIIPLCRSSRTDCHIGFGSCSLSLGYVSSYGNCRVILVRQSAVLVRSCDTGNILAECSYRFLLIRLHRGMYLKYCYSVVNEREREFCPSIIFAVGKVRLIGKNSRKL